MPVPLLTSADCTHHVHLIVGDNGIAAKRATRSLEAGATCFLLSPKNVQELDFNLKDLIENAKITHVPRQFQEEDLKTFGRMEVDCVVDMVFVTLSPLDKQGRSFLTSIDISILDRISL